MNNHLETDFKKDPIATGKYFIENLMELSKYSQNYCFGNKKKYHEIKKEINTILLRILTKHLFIEKRTVLDNKNFKRFMLINESMEVFENDNFKTKITLSSDENSVLICEILLKKQAKPLHLIRSENIMYERKAHQTTFFEDATLFGGVRLNPENRWVRMSRLIPWAVFETQYAAFFTNPREGKPAKSARMAIGALIIKKRYGFSDEDTVEEIRVLACSADTKYLSFTI